MTHTHTFSVQATRSDEELIQQQMTRSLIQQKFIEKTLHLQTQAINQQETDQCFKEQYNKQV